MADIRNELHLLHQHVRLMPDQYDELIDVDHITLHTDRGPSYGQEVKCSGPDGSRKWQCAGLKTGAADHVSRVPLLDTRDFTADLQDASGTCWKWAAHR